MAAAGVEIIGIALPKPEALERQTKRIGGALRIRCLMALTL